MLFWLTQPGNGVAYSIQAQGPHGPDYRLACLPVSRRQLEAGAGRVHSSISNKNTVTPLPGLTNRNIF